MRVEARGVSWAAGGARILANVTFACAPGTVVGLVGPNGSGKSTLLRCLYRVLRPDAGMVTIDRADVWSTPVRDIARSVAVVLQTPPADALFTVRDMVLMGRAPHKRLLERDTTDDMRRVDHALDTAGVAALAERQFDTLSGGEKQRVMIARALAQSPRLLVLDESTSHLDIGHQLDILALMRGIGITVIAALHDLNLAATYCDQILVLQKGSIAASGSPAEVLTAELIEQVYGVRALVGRHPLTDRPHVFVDIRDGNR